MKFQMTFIMTLNHNMSVTMTVSLSYAVTIDLTLTLISIDEPPRRRQSCDGDVKATMTMTNQK